MHFRDPRTLRPAALGSPKHLRIRVRYWAKVPRFPGSPLMIRAPFFLLLSLNIGTQREQKAKTCTTGEATIGA